MNTRFRIPSDANPLPLWLRLLISALGLILSVCAPYALSVELEPIRCAKEPGSGINIESSVFDQELADTEFLSAMRAMLPFYKWRSMSPPDISLDVVWRLISWPASICDTVYSTPNGQQFRLLNIHETETHQVYYLTKGPQDKDFKAYSAYYETYIELDENGDAWLTGHVSHHISNSKLEHQIREWRKYVASVGLVRSCSINKRGKIPDDRCALVKYDLIDSAGLYAPPFYIFNFVPLTGQILVKPPQSLIERRLAFILKEDGHFTPDHPEHLNAALCLVWLLDNDKTREDFLARVESIIGHEIEYPFFKKYFEIFYPLTT